MKIDTRKFIARAEPAFMVAKESPLIPAFEFVLIAPIGEGQVSVTAANSNHTVRVVVEVVLQPAKSFCISAPEFWSILKTLDGEVEIDPQSTDIAVVTCGGVSLEVPTMKTKSFTVAGTSPSQPKIMSVDIEEFVEMVSDLSYFLEKEDGIAPGRQNILLGEKGAYAFNAFSGAVVGKHSSPSPMLVPPSIRGVMSKMTGIWDVFSGDGWVLFQQGDAFYKKNVPQFKTEEAIGQVHPIIATAANTKPIASFEVARIATAIARAVVIGAEDVVIQGFGDKITVMCRNDMRGLVLEEVIPADGAIFKTAMKAKVLHGIMEIVGYGGIVEVSPQTSPSRSDWPPSLLLRNKDKKFIAIIGPVVL